MLNEQNIQGLPEGMRVREIFLSQTVGDIQIWDCELEPAIPDTGTDDDKLSSGFVEAASRHLDRVEAIAAFLDNMAEEANESAPGSFAGVGLHRMADDLRKLDLRSASPTEITDSQHDPDWLALARKRAQHCNKFPASLVCLSLQRAIQAIDAAMEAVEKK